MKIERIDDKTVKCFLSNEELEEYDIDYKDFVTRSDKAKEVVQEIPLEALVLETDSPYLAPVPHRGKRNNSQNLVYVAEEIAALKGVSYEEVVRQTTENAKKLYRLEK